MDEPEIGEDVRGHAWALAFALAGCTFLASYVTQRLLAAGTGTPDWTLVTNVAHVPFYWRCALALFQAALVASTVGLAASDEWAAKALRAAPVWVPAVALAAAVAMAVVP